MATNVGKLAVVVSASAGGLYAGLTKAQAAIKQFGTTATQVAGAAGVAFGGLSAVGAAQWALGLAANLERTQMQFGVLIGNAQQASSILGQLRQFDIVSPLGLETLLNGTKTMLQFGVATQQVVPIVKMLGDVSMGNADQFSRLSLVMGQVAAASKLTGQDLLQFVNAGWNPLQQIAQRTGETMAQVRERMSAGAVSFDEVHQALVDATSAGGRFAGMIEAGGQTVAGRFEMLKGRVEALATSLGITMLPAATSVVGALESMVAAIGSIDGRSALASAQVIAFAGSFLLTVTYAGRVVAAMRNIVAAIRAMSMAQAVFQALSGPQGWATLAASLVVAAGAVAAVEFAFSGVSTEAEKAVQQTKALAEQGDKAGSATANAVKSAAQASADLSAKLSEVAGKWADATAGAERHRELLERGAQLAEQFAPPEAVFAGTVQELQDLAAAGAITQEVFDAAFSEAANKLGQARMEAAGLNEQIQGLGAAAANTMEGFRAMADARRATEQAVGRATIAANVQPQIDLTGATQQVGQLAAAGQATQGTIVTAFAAVAAQIDIAKSQADNLNGAVQAIGNSANVTSDALRNVAIQQAANQAIETASKPAANQQIIAMQRPERTADTVFAREMRDIMRETRDTLQELLNTTKTKPTLVVGTAELY
jgi:tape measure domain-containing protein